MNDRTPIDSGASTHKTVDMRTTVDLPDQLFRELKVKAALDGLKLKDLLQQYCELGLRLDGPSASPAPQPRRSPLPVIVSAAPGVPIPALTNAALAAFEVEEDVATHDRLTRR